MECKVDKTPGMECKMFINHSIISYKSTNPGMEFKSELFHPTKIKIELTFFENFENELFTIFIKNFNTLELTLGTEVNSIVHFVRKQLQ